MQKGAQIYDEVLWFEFLAIFSICSWGSGDERRVSESVQLHVQ